VTCTADAIWGEDEGAESVMLAEEALPNNPRTMRPQGVTDELACHKIEGPISVTTAPVRTRLRLVWCSHSRRGMVFFSSDSVLSRKCVFGASPPLVRHVLLGVSCQHVSHGPLERNLFLNCFAEKVTLSTSRDNANSFKPQAISVDRGLGEISIHRSCECRERSSSERAASAGGQRF